MEVDSDNSLLGKAAAGELVATETWPAMRDDILARLDRIARNEFPIPNLPPPIPRPRILDARLLSPSPSPSSSSSPAEQPAEDANKENAPVDEEQPPPSTADSEPAAAPQPPAPAEQPPSSQPSSQASSQTPSQTQEPDVLPRQLADMVEEIKSHIGSFESYPPHTIQRIAELILFPRAHYKALSSYLHALDRVAAVTSGTDTYPLPPPIPDMSSMQLNGDGPSDASMAIVWTNPNAAAVGSDEALGGALLTPIPWLTRRSSPPESASEPPAGAQIHSEGTETIDGPNGMGSIETVSVSINGVASMGHSRGVTQGELLRQEQRAGVVPVSQLAKAQDALAEGSGRGGGSASASDDQPMNDGEEEEAPRARGPDEIGVNDTGPQSETTSVVGEDGIEMEGIDLEAAVGRKHADEKNASPESSSSSTAEEKKPANEASSSERAKSPSAESVGSKREAEDDLEEDIVAKKMKEDDDTPMSLSEETADAEESKDEDKGDEVDSADKDAEKMET